MSPEKPDDMTKTLALYRHLVHGWITEMQFRGDDDHKYHVDYVRISEPETMVFQPLHDDSVIQNALQKLDTMEQAARLELGEKLAKIQQQRANFLALTYQPEVA